MSKAVMITVVEMVMVSPPARACSAMAARGDLLLLFSFSTGTVFRAALIEMMVTRDLPRQRMIQHTHHLRALLTRNTLRCFAVSRI